MTYYLFYKKFYYISNLFFCHFQHIKELNYSFIIAIIPVTVLVMVTAGKTTQALTSRKKNKETAADDGIAE